MCMSPDEMTIDQLRDLETAYRDRGWDDYADQTEALRAKRVADGWNPDFVPEVTPRWTRELQAARHGDYSTGSADRVSKRRGEDHAREFWSPDVKAGWSSESKALWTDVEAQYAAEKAAQAEKFAKHLAHL